MVALLRSLRAASAAVRPVMAARPAGAKLNLSRAFSASQLRADGPAPPTLLGDGAKAGEVPTECVQL